MRLIDAQLDSRSGGGILYDAQRIRNPSGNLFEPAYWAGQGAIQEVRGGRGAVSFIRPGSQSTEPADAWVLRHYRRGGLVASLLQDRYLWTGANRTRCFAEWRLLATLHERGLPVPAPVAARYVRSGLTYRADLITVQLPPSRTLAQAMTAGSLSEQQWHAVGRTIAAFHRQGVHHADLNAHNILLGADDAVFILDFDRGRIRARGSWEQRVLDRLHRSLQKISAQSTTVSFDAGSWAMLVAGYREGR